MPLLLSIALAVALKPVAPSYEGAWLREGSKEEIYRFEKGRFRLIIRFVYPSTPEGAFDLIYLEQGTYRFTTKATTGGAKRQFLDLERTSIEPPHVVRGMARNEPKRLVFIEQVSPNVLSIDFQRWVRIDSNSVPSTVEEVKTMKIKPFAKKPKI